MNLFKRTVRFISSLVGIFLLLVALWVLYRELKVYHYRDVVRYLSEIPNRRLFLSLVLTALNYWILTAYESLGFFHIRHPLGYRKIALLLFFTSEIKDVNSVG